MVCFVLGSLIIEGGMITMECQPGGHGGHLGHSMMLDPSSGVMHQQEQENKKKRKCKKKTKRLFTGGHQSSHRVIYARLSQRKFRGGVFMT